MRITSRLFFILGGYIGMRLSEKVLFAITSDERYSCQSLLNCFLVSNGFIYKKRRELLK